LTGASSRVVHGTGARRDNKGTAHAAHGKPCTRGSLAEAQIEEKPRSKTYRSPARRTGLFLNFQCLKGEYVMTSRTNSRQTAPTQSGAPDPGLAIREEKRIRSMAHLPFVAQACLICGPPCHAHHIRYAQARGVALKVSDEFTVPLCAIDHTEDHGTGDERRWWADHNVDPLPGRAPLARKPTLRRKPRVAVRCVVIWVA